MHNLNRSCVSLIARAIATSAQTSLIGQQCLRNVRLQISCNNQQQTMLLLQLTRATSTSAASASMLDALRAHEFARKHIGPSDEQISEMLSTINCQTLDELVDKTVPESIRLERALKLPTAIDEADALIELSKIASANESHEWRSYIGLGFYNTRTPSVILRNMFENVKWTTAYTAYQPEIAQGRLESLLNFQTMVSDLTRLPVANASLLDEGTAAAEAMQVCIRHHSKSASKEASRNKFLVSTNVNLQTLAVLETRARGLGIEVVHFNELSNEGKALLLDERKMRSFAGCLIQYPNVNGELINIDSITKPCKVADCLVVVASDLLALTLFKPPGDFDEQPALVVGSAQRFGVPLNFGGPSAAFMACKQSLVRQIPGRIVGVTRDSSGKRALRFALQTREQHIRRERATSNICTSQALLANMSAMYAVYHGASGLREIASSVHMKTNALAVLIESLNATATASGNARVLNKQNFFDTLTIECKNRDFVRKKALEAKINLRYDSQRDNVLSISLDETTKLCDVVELANLFVVDNDDKSNVKLTLDDEIVQQAFKKTPPLFNEANNNNINNNENNLNKLKRTSDFLTHENFNKYQSEAQIVRYMNELASRDITLANSMIPLGSCTMKLNATSELIGASWPQFANCHPFAPREQTKGYATLLTQLNEYLCEITGYDKISFQPNSGAQGEFAGLSAIAAYLKARDAGSKQKRDVCLIPVSAHGTNPASAQMAGFSVQPIRVNATTGDIELDDLRAKLEQFKDRVACLMITYPSTFGVFEEHVRQVCDLTHAAGAQVYLDGANMNAQVGVCRPADLGADVSHLNLHKTFCIPHGGGGPGAGPIGVKRHLVPYLPTHALVDQASDFDATNTANSGFGSVSSAMFGSPAILPISWTYIRQMGAEGLKRATQVAILNANYMRARLEHEFKILYKGARGNVAHEFIIDCRGFKRIANVEAADIAKRLQDFSLHSATVSWPVTNTLMLEPTESEDKQQLDNYCDALLQIKSEIDAIATGKLSTNDNPIKNAPHTQQAVCATHWPHAYSREQAAFPAPFVQPATKVWPSVGRVDDTYGDTNLFCTCAPMSDTI